MADHKYGKKIENQMASIVVDSEYRVSKQNNSVPDTEFESYVDLFDAARAEKEYDWMSDISLPEFPSHMLTQSSIDVSQYFQSRDFVEAYLQDGSDEAKAAADAAKECVNRTLNQKHIHHYQKYVRGKLINHLVGHVYMECWWEQELKNKVVGQDIEIVEDEETGEFVEREVDVEREVPVIDRFNYDIHDPRNVFTDNNYVYTIQDNDYVIIRSEKTYFDLKAEETRAGYFNLDAVKELRVDGQTETKKDTNKDDKVIPDKTPNKSFDVLKRYGKFWCDVIERDEEGEPTEVKPGIDDSGEPLDGAELHEVIITYVMNKSDNILIGFNLTPYADHNGMPYRPLIRGLCYIHPTESNGVGDGKYASEVQIALDDTFNISNDRVMMATLPTIKTKKFSSEDNDSLYFAPGHRMEVENIDDVQEFKMSDNVAGAMNQMQMLMGKMQQVTSIYPTTMGQTPAEASTTATAVAGAESRTDMRTNYKSMTFENTALTELYHMILQMTNAFAHPETGEKLMGEKVYDFDPSLDYFYKPVSASIETEQSKSLKVRNWNQVGQMVAGIGHPDTVTLMNYVLSQVFTNMGDEYANFGDKLLNPETPIQQGPAGAEGAEIPNMGAETSNQNGRTVFPMEAATRGVMSETR
ncbi:hypothetical protein KAR91_56340 [Candidatus Pacearchaeota archaeon]|nr:hypothetical protein [Candidatus Pacearchaeota archaeon]